MAQVRKIDRRIERTRQLLRDALMALIVENGYESITVQDITDRANVARTTFYLHYKDKDELLFEGMRDIYDELFTCISWDIEKLGCDTIMSTPADFLHVAEHADFYRVMFSDKGSASFLVRVWQYLAEEIERQILRQIVAQGQLKPRMPLPALAYFMAGAQIGLLKWWLRQDMAIPAEEMAHMSEQTLVQGLMWSLGADDGH